jgi:hypothetical protein
MNEQNESMMNDSFKHVGLSADWVDDAWCLWQNGESHSSYGLVAVESEGESVDLYYASGNVPDEVFEKLGSTAVYFLLAREVPVSVVLRMRQNRMFAMLSMTGKQELLARNDRALLPAEEDRSCTNP